MSSQGTTASTRRLYEPEGGRWRRSRCTAPVDEDKLGSRRVAEEVEGRRDSIFSHLRLGNLHRQAGRTLAVCTTRLRSHCRITSRRAAGFRDGKGGICYQWNMDIVRGSTSSFLTRSFINNNAPSRWIPLTRPRRHQRVHRLPSRGLTAVATFFKRLGVGRDIVGIE